MRYLVVWIILVSIIICGAEADAQDVPCSEVAALDMVVDGMDSDWVAVGTSLPQASKSEIAVTCARGGDTLFLYIRVVDASILRTKSYSDRLVVALSGMGGRSLTLGLLPGTKTVKHTLQGVDRTVKLDDSLTPNGFAVEVSIPLAKVPGWNPSLPYLHAEVRFSDRDAGTAKKLRTLRFRGQLHFADAWESYREFRRKTGMVTSTVRLDRLANVTGHGGERVIVGGTVLGVLGTGYRYMGLPIDSSEDLLACRIVDFDGTGRHAILTELRQRGNGGSRDVLVVWYVRKDGFDRALTIEIRKELEEEFEDIAVGAFLANRWSLVKRGKRAKDLLIEMGEMKGFTADNFREVPATDAIPILTPFSGPQKRRYSFAGGIAVPNGI